MPRAGARTDTIGNAVNNKILNALPDREFDEFRSQLEFVKLQYHKNIYESTEKIDYGGFINLGMVKLVVTTSDGRSGDVVVVGREVCVGTPLAAGIDKS